MTVQSRVRDAGLLETITGAVAGHADRLEGVLVNAVVIDSARQNDKRPAFLKVSVFDDWVRNMRGGAALADAYIMLRIPRDVLEDVTSRPEAEPPIEPRTVLDQISEVPEDGGEP